VIYFGGNGEQIWGRVRDRGWVSDRGWNLALVSYRGYDQSTGDPSGDALLADTSAIYDALSARDDVDGSKIVAWGFSLGTGLAARLAHERPIVGVILAAPYARLSDTAAEHYPWLPVRWLFRHEIDTLAIAPAIDAPLLVVHGEADTMIPSDQGRRVIDAWRGRTQWTEVTGAGHNDLSGRPELRQAVVHFLDEQAPPPSVAVQAKPSTIVPSGEPPPRVARALAAISADRIRADIDALAGFGTRHTLSADVPTRGIAAARRYLVAQLEAAVDETRAGGAMTITLDRHHLEPDGSRIDRSTDLVNVVATLPGTMPEARARHVYVMGHYDSRASDVMDPQADAPGANDDASGVALTLELARVFANEPTDATLVFMATAGEEQGLLGARRHAATAASEGRVIGGVLSNDIIGDPSSPGGERHDREVRVFSAGVALSADGDALAGHRSTGSLADGDSRQLARYVAMIAAWQQTSVRPTLVFRPDRFLRGGDHLAFDEQGYPAVRFTEVSENYDRQHQDPRMEGERRFGDLPEHVDASYLAEVTRLDGAVLLHLANAPAAPQGAVVVATALTIDTSLRWDANPEPDVAGYEVVWRRTDQPIWEHVKDVGDTVETTLPLHKDDWIFGVRAYDHEGYRSPVAACGILRE